MSKNPVTGFKAARTERGNEFIRKHGRNWRNALKGDGMSKELIERLRTQASEIAGQRINGWGNTMTEAADRIAALEQQLTEQRSIAFAAQKEASRCAELERENRRLSNVVDQLLAHCEDPECLECGKAICPHGEPLHFHHDGCPACCQDEARANS